MKSFQHLQSRSKQISINRKKKNYKKIRRWLSSKIGVSSFSRKFGEVFYLRGLTDDGKELDAQLLNKNKVSQTEGRAHNQYFPRENEKLKFKRESISAPELSGSNFSSSHKCMASKLDYDEFKPNHLGCGNKDILPISCKRSMGKRKFRRD